MFRIVVGAARDRVISTVDTETRHGHKSRSRHFDGYKGHVVVDPDGEIIEDVTVTAANVHDSDALDGQLAAHRRRRQAGGGRRLAYGSGKTRHTMGETVRTQLVERGHCAQVSISALAAPTR